MFAKGCGGVGWCGAAWLEGCVEVVGGGRGDGGGDAAGLAAPDPGLARGMCALECEGVGGPEDDGDNGSVTQSLQTSISPSANMTGLAYRCDFVATIFATVCARVEAGFTWKTGNESLPSSSPRVDRITEIKWVHVFWSSGNDEERVRSYNRVRKNVARLFGVHTLTSVVEILPITFK